MILQVGAHLLAGSIDPPPGSIPRSLVVQLLSLDLGVGVSLKRSQTVRRKWAGFGKTGDVTLPETNIAMEHIPIFNKKYIFIQGPFSIAMFWIYPPPSNSGKWRFTGIPY